MAKNTISRRSWINGWRIAAWGAALALLAVPLVAMQFTDEVRWTLADFAFAAVLVLVFGMGLELAARFGGGARSAGITIASLAAVLTLWANAAVGLVGAEGGPVNTGFTLLVVGGALLSLIVRFQPRAMRLIMALIALGQVAMGFAAQEMMPGHAVEWGVIGFFASAWAASALCFHIAHRRMPN